MTLPSARVMPADLVAAAEREGRRSWLTRVPAVITLLAKEWALIIGEPFQPGGQTARVAPVRRDGQEFALKVLWRHPEAEHEADGLAVWNGHGSVRLHAYREVDAATIGLLLERCQPGTSLATLPEPEQDSVIAGLLRRLWIEPPPGYRFRPLAAMCQLWADEYEQKTAEGLTSGLDAGLLREGVSLFRELPASAERNVLLCTDLHAGNVLAAKREPWLAIDPKPYVGDPTYDALQHLLNCDRLHTGPRELTHRMGNLLDLDADRLMLWLFARCIQESPGWPALAQVAQEIAPR